MNIKEGLTIKIMSLTLMLFFRLCSMSEAAPIIVYGGSITIANNATTSQRLGGDITINGEASDMVVDSTITLYCPWGLIFDINVPLQIGTNVIATVFSVSLYNGDGYVNGYRITDGKAIKLKVNAVPVTGMGTVQFRSNMGNNSDLSVLPGNPNDTGIDETGLQFKVVTNEGTNSPLTTNIGTANILKVPTIQSARFTDSTHLTIQFNCNIDSSTATGHSTALGSGRDLSTPLSADGLCVGNADFTVTDATAAIDGTDPTKVNVTIITGAIKTDGNSTIQTTTGIGDGNARKFVNAKDNQDTPTITSLHANAPHTAVNIILSTASINSITLSKTTVGCSTGFFDAATGLASDSSNYCPFKSGKPLDSNNQILDDAFIATVSATTGTEYKVRLAYKSSANDIPLTTNNLAWEADCISGSTTVLLNDAGAGGKHRISGANNDGALNIYFQLKDGLGNSNSNLASGKSGQIVVQASLDDFATTSGIISSNPITVDRILPTMDKSTGNAPRANSSNTVQVVFSEAIKKASAEISSAFCVESATGTNRPVQSVSLAPDNKIATVTTTVMPLSAPSTIWVSPMSKTIGTKPTYVTDLVGNRIAETSSTFTSPGGVINAITVTQPSTTPPRVANGNILTVQVNAATGSTVQVHLAKSSIASTTTTYADKSTVTLAEVTSGVYKTVSSFPTVNSLDASGVLVVIASNDNWTTRTVDEETVTLDNTKPSVSSATAIGNRKVLVNFNETLDTSTIAASNFYISPTTGILGIASAEARPSKTAVLLSFSGTASTGITYTVTASSSVKDETTVNGVGAANSASFTSSSSDTRPPTINNTDVATGNSKVTVYLTDDSGKEAVDISTDVSTSRTRITSVTKDGKIVSGTVTNDVTDVACIFTPESGAFDQGDYLVNLSVTDLAGNTGFLSTSFSVCGSQTCSANPETITMSGGTSAISVSGCNLTYTAEIITDTTGGAVLTGSSPAWILTPGLNAGSMTVRISDSQSPVQTCDVSVTYSPCQFTLYPTKSAVNNEKILIEASGGTPPYVYELITAIPTGAAIDVLSGDYLAPAAGPAQVNEIIQAIDAKGCVAKTTLKISTSAIAVTTSGSGTDSVMITGPAGATHTIDDGVGSVTSGGVYTSAEDGIGIVKVSKSSEWAKLVIKAEDSIFTVIEPTKVQDVNMDTHVNINDLTPVIDWILGSLVSSSPITLDRILPPVDRLSDNAQKASKSKTGVPHYFSGTASTGNTYTVTADSSVKDETTVNVVGTDTFMSLTSSGHDTQPPTISSMDVFKATGSSKVTVYLTDDSGKEAVDISQDVNASKTKITSVTKDGKVVNGTVTNDVAKVACLFTPASGIFDQGDYLVNLSAADRTGNSGLLSTSFSVYGAPSCSADPSTITTSSGDSSISVSGGKPPYNAEITSDTTGGATLKGSSPTWRLTPGFSAGSMTVRFSDSQSPVQTCDVSVTYSPCQFGQLYPTKSAVNNEKILIDASGGTPPYVYELMTYPPTGGAIDLLSGDYLAPAAGETQEIENIQAIDTGGCIATTILKISTSSVSVTTSGSGTASVTINGGTGATYTIDDGVGVGSVTSAGVYTSTSDGVGIVKVSKSGEWAKVVIRVEKGICTVQEPVAVQDVNMDTQVNINDLTPVIDWILIH